MTDIHCHILPASDNGAETMADALAMIRAAAAGGVTSMVATPHCNLPGDCEKNYVSFGLRDRFVALCLAVRQEKIPVEILPGSEVLCTPELPELLYAKQLLPLAGSRYLLAEFLFDEPLSFMDAMLQTIANYGLVPVVAHPERYDAIQQQPQAVSDWLERGYALQLDKDSILGGLGGRAERTAHWLLERKLAQLAASDAHDPIRRTTPLDELRSLLSQAYSPACADLLLRDNPRRILRGQALQIQR